MYTVECTLEGVSPLSFSRQLTSVKGKETDDAFERRVWRERIHVTESGEAFIPAMALKKCLVESATYQSENIKGKGNNTYTKHFLAGVQVNQPMMLGVQGSTIPGEWHFVPSDGKPGGPRRVPKCFARLDKWSTKATIYCYDPVIEPDKLIEYLKHSGQFIGLLRFRPRRGGYYGQFRVKDVKVTQD